MFGKIWFSAVALAVAVVSSAGSQVFDYSQYPDLRGQWDRFIVPGLPGQPSFDQTMAVFCLMRNAMRPAE
jgi:hypothetical protein